MGELTLIATIILGLLCLIRIGQLKKAVQEKEAGGQFDPPQRPVVSAAPSTPPLLASPPPSAVALPVASAAIGAETIAAISAAISVVMDDPYTITSITPAASTDAYTVAAVAAVAALPERRRPVWGFAGMQQNTRPF